MTHYTPIEPLIPERVLCRLQDHFPNGVMLTVRKAGPLTVGEQQLPKDLCEELRATMDFGGSASLYVRLSSTEAVKAKEKAAKRRHLAKNAHPPTAIKYATGCSDAAARAELQEAGIKTTRKVGEPNERTLWAGMAAIRQYHGTTQVDMAKMVGWSAGAVSDYERKLLAPNPDRVNEYLAALALHLRTSKTRLHKLAMQAGEAVLDSGVPDGPDVPEDGAAVDPDPAT